MEVDASELGFNMRQMLREEDSFDLQQQDKWASFGNFQLVGHGKRTSDKCGKYLSLKGYLRTDLHNRVSLDGVDYSGKVFVRLVHHSCDEPSCPVCYKSGWAVRQARKMEVRTKEASKRLGVAEHIVMSVPSSCYGLSYDELRAFAVKALYARGIVGGGMIFHGFRYNVGRHWNWSVHFHVLGFLRGGYECRGCEKGVCLGCHGFESRTRRVYERDGCIVKVLGKRKTIFGTAWYQLNHSTIDVTKKRFHVVTWFGACSYRKLKVTVEKWKDLCPICSEECVKVHYFGLRHIAKEKGAAGYEAAFTDNLLGADSEPMWILEDGRSYH